MKSSGFKKQKGKALILVRDICMERPTSKSALARSLGLSRSSLYYHPKRPAKDEVLRERILTVLDDHPAYGHRRIALHLHINKKRIIRVMNRYHIRPTVVRKGRNLRKLSKDTRVSETPNHLKNFCPIQPDVVWVGDFTHLWFHGRYVYLATVLDHFTREVIGWQVGLHHTSQLIIDVFEEAKRKRVRLPGYFHSDQGSEYTSHGCVHWLVHHDIIPSNSPKGKPWNNGRQESFYSSFKLEFGKPQRFDTIEQLVEAIGKHIHYYNTKRIHSRLKMPPRQYYEKTKYDAVKSDKPSQ